MPAPVVALSVLAPLLHIGQVFSIAAMPAPPPYATVEYTLTATPSENLTDGTNVTATGTGLEPGVSGYVHQCQDPASTFVDCDLAGAGTTFTADPSGAFEVSFTVYRKIYTNAGEVDCAVAPCGIALFVGETPVAPSTMFPIPFDPTAPLLPPASISAGPTSGLSSGQTVSVHGEGLRAYDHALLVQCTTSSLPTFGVCNPLIVDTQANEQGVLETSYEVRSVIGVHPEATEDCRVTECSLALLRFDSPVPDQFALEFTTRPTPVGPPASPAPASVVQPQFTG